MRGERFEGEFVASLPCYLRIDGELEVPEPELAHVELPPERWEIYRDLEEGLVTWVSTPAGSAAELAVDIPVVLRTRLRTATLGTMACDNDGEVFFPDNTKSTELVALEEIISRPGWQTESLGIYTDYKRFARVVVNRMRAAGYDALEWSGDVNSLHRKDIKHRFCIKECNISSAPSSHFRQVSMASKPFVIRTSGSPSLTTTCSTIR